MGPRRSSALADKSSSQRFDNVHAQVCGNFRAERRKPANLCRPRSSVRSGESSDWQSASTMISSPSKHDYRTKSRNRFVFIFSTPLSPVGEICPPNPHARRNASCRTRNRPGILSIGRHLADLLQSATLAIPISIWRMVTAAKEIETISARVFQTRSASFNNLAISSAVIDRRYSSVFPMSVRRPDPGSVECFSRCAPHKESSTRGRVSSIHESSY